MANTIAIKPANLLPPLPAQLLTSKIIVTDLLTGALYMASAAMMQQVLPVVMTVGDFAIALEPGQVLEYVCLDSDTPAEILIGTTLGGSEIYSFTGASAIVDGQPIALMRYAKDAQSIFFTGVNANTKVKIKIV